MHVNLTCSGLFTYCDNDDSDDDEDENVFTYDICHYGSTRQEEEEGQSTDTADSAMHRSSMENLATISSKNSLYVEM